ncbi:MAG: hypothetical protein VKL39_16815, partial [Leptolyngbyaceae bacterium]|nr:hypothetical protein [Leptolyngbyaceae bacterium]
LDASKQREAKLSTRIQDLEAQLSQQTRAVEKLRLDLEVIQTSKKEILADLAEAKRYVLQLTDLKQSSVAQEKLTQADSSPAIAPSSTSSIDSGHRSMHRSNGRSPQPTPSPQPTSFPTPGRQSIPIRPKKHASTRSPVLSSSALKGLPPMSTERLKASPMSRPQSPSPAPSRPSQPHSSGALSRVPRSHMAQPSSPHESQAKQDSQSQQDSQPKGIQLQKAYRRPLVHHRDRPIPQAARDTRTYVPKPKLSDSEISWFD